MAEEQTQQSAPENGEAPAAEQQPPAAEQRTPEDVEAFWKHRQSQSDKAHAEEARVLREALVRAEAAAATNVEAGASGDEVATQLQQQNRELQQKLEQSETQRVVDTRRALYPNAAGALEDNNLIAQMDEARLAGLNAKLSTEAAAPPPPPVDPNNPARGAAAPAKRLSDMDANELKQVMEQNSAEWLAEVKGFNP